MRWKKFSLFLNNFISLIGKNLLGEKIDMNINKFNFYFIKILILIHYIYNINAYAKENINICIDEFNPPFMFKNSNNKADGLYYNIINWIIVFFI